MFYTMFIDSKVIEKKKIKLNITVKITNFYSSHTLNASD